MWCRKDSNFYIRSLPFGPYQLSYSTNRLLESSDGHFVRTGARSGAFGVDGVNVLAVGGVNVLAVGAGRFHHVFDVGGIPGGIFTPSLTIGAMIGEHMASFAQLGDASNVAVLLCMAAFLILYFSSIFFSKRLSQTSKQS